MSNSLSPQLFFEECKQILGFLTDEYGFSIPILEHGMIPNVYKVTFYKKEIAIECSYDLRDKGDSFYIVKLTNDRKPDVFRKDGEIVRQHLSALLIAGGIRDISFEDKKKELGTAKNDEELFHLRKSLLGHARLLKLYGQDILAGSARIFEK